MTAIAMILLLCGVLIFCMGWVSKPRVPGALGAGGLMMIGGTFVGVFGNPSRDMPNGSPVMAAVGFILGTAGLVLFIRVMSATVKETAKRSAEAKEAEKVAFYDACAAAGIHQCESEMEIEKATLIAKQKGMKFADVRELFREAEVQKGVSVQRKEDQAFEAKRAEDRRLYRELCQYEDKAGRDKRIAMLTAEKKEEERSAKVLRDGAQALMSASQQKEMDWAVHGGIASGIAGGAAGLAVASDIQAKNAQIRAQNEANRKAFAPVMMTSYEGASKHERRAEALGEQIRAASAKLLAKDTAQECIEKLRFSDGAVEVTEAGSLIVTVRAECKDPLFFDESLHLTTEKAGAAAVIDGTVAAKIYDGNDLVGACPLVFPSYGVSNVTMLRGICLFCGSREREYTVRFGTSNLWGMER